MSKISILCLYRRIFTTESFRLHSLIVGLGVLSYWIASVLGFLLMCRPIRAIWKTNIPISCIDTAALFLGLELFNCIMDIAILCLPLQVLWKLQMSTEKKGALAIMFTLGSLQAILSFSFCIGLANGRSVFVAGIVRMALCYRTNSRTRKATFTVSRNRIDAFSVPLYLDVVTSMVENGLAIICASLPTYGSILSKRWRSILGECAKKLAGSWSRQHGSVEVRNSDNEYHCNVPAIRKIGCQEKTDITKSWGSLDLEDDVLSDDYLLPEAAHVRNTTDLV